MKTINLNTRVNKEDKDNAMSNLKDMKMQMSVLIDSVLAIMADKKKYKKFVKMIDEL